MPPTQRVDFPWTNCVCKKKKVKKGFKKKKKKIKKKEENVEAADSPYGHFTIKSNNTVDLVNLKTILHFALDMRFGNLKRSKT